MVAARLGNDIRSRRSPEPDLRMPDLSHGEAEASGLRSAQTPRVPVMPRRVVMPNMMGMGMSVTACAVRGLAEAGVARRRLPPNTTQSATCRSGRRNVPTSIIHNPQWTPLPPTARKRAAIRARKDGIWCDLRKARYGREGPISWRCRDDNVTLSDADAAQSPENPRQFLTRTDRQDRGNHRRKETPPCADFLLRCFA